MSTEMDIETLYDELVSWREEAISFGKGRLADHLDILIAHIEMEEL